MADEIRAGARPSDAVSPSTAASVATLVSAAATIVGVLGQMAMYRSVGFAMLAGFGLATLATIVFAHQQ